MRGHQTKGRSTSESGTRVYLLLPQSRFEPRHAALPAAVGLRRRLVIGCLGRRNGSRCRPDRCFTALPRLPTSYEAAIAAGGAPARAAAFIAGLLGVAKKCYPRIETTICIFWN